MEIENHQEDVTDPIPTTTEHCIDELPNWAIKAMKKSVQQASKIQKTICKKDNGIKRLENHVKCNTIPGIYLKIHIKFMVTEEHQTNLNNTVTEAINECQYNIMNSLIEIRKEERKKLLTELRTIEITWCEETLTTLIQIEEEQLLKEASSTLIVKLHSHWKKKVKDIGLKVRTDNFLTLKQDALDERKRFQERV